MNKKDLIKKFKQTVPPMGIFQIKNLKTGKIFIGRAKNLPGIINRHRFQLENGLHSNQELQKDFNEIGPEGFSFEPLDCLTPREDPGHDYTGDLKTLEDMWLEKLRPYHEIGYHTKKK
jgi:hypothetical protein